VLTMADVLGLGADAWQAVAALVGLPAIVVSLWVLIGQSRQTVEAERAAVHQGITEAMLDIDRLFFDHPEFRKYIYDGVEPPAGGLEREKVEALGEMMLDFVDNCIAQLDRLDSDQAADWREYVREIVGTSPVMQEFLAKHEDWYREVARSLGPAGAGAG
jgi:hypothetical protein